MMTVWTLIGHGFWICGLAALLTVGSFQSWERAKHVQSRDGQKSQPDQRWISLGLLLVTFGLLLVTTSLLERSLWGGLSLILTGIFGMEQWNAYQQTSHLPPRTQPNEPRQSLIRRLRASPQTRWVIGTLVSAGALYLAFRGVDYSSVGATLLHANATFILLALLSVAINTLVKATRWHVLIGDRGKPIRLREVLRVLLISQMLNTIIPARVGELSRAYMIGRQGPGSAFILGTVAIEKLIDVIVYLILFAFLVLLMPVPAWISQPIYPFAIISISSMLIALLISRYQHELLGFLSRSLHWLPLRLQERITRLVGSALASLAILKDWRNSLAVGWWSAIVWITAILNNYLVLRAIGITAPPPAALLVLIVLQAGIAIPSVPGKIGVFQYLCILALNVFTVDRTLSLSYGVLLQAIVFLPTTTIGVLLLWASGLTLRGSTSLVMNNSPDSLPPPTND